MDPQQRLLLEVVYEALEDGKSPLTSSPLTITILITHYLSWHPPLQHQRLPHICLCRLFHK